MKALFEKSFIDYTLQDAFERAQKFLNKQMKMCLKKNLKVSFSMNKVACLDGDKKEVKVACHLLLDEKDEETKFCKICKDMHKSFFINENYNCNRCNYKAFKTRVNDREKIAAKYVKEQMRQ